MSGLFPRGPDSAELGLCGHRLVADTEQCYGGRVKSHFSSRNSKGIETGEVYLSHLDPGKSTGLIASRMQEAGLIKWHS